MTFKNYLIEITKAQATIDKLDKIIKRERAAYIKHYPYDRYAPRDLNFLTPKQREELHQAKLALPSYGEEATAAKKRIQARIKARKQK